KTRHRHYTHAVAKLFRRSERMLQLATARHNDQIEFAVFLLRDITASRDAFASRLNVDIVQNRNDLTRERKKCWPIDSLHGSGKGTGGFFWIGRPNYVD